MIFGIKYYWQQEETYDFVVVVFRCVCVSVCVSQCVCVCLSVCGWKCLQKWMCRGPGLMLGIFLDRSPPHSTDNFFQLKVTLQTPLVQLTSFLWGFFSCFPSTRIVCVRTGLDYHPLMWMWGI